MADTFASFNVKLARLQKEMESPKLMHDVGKMAKKEATKAASADLGGDPKFSGWAPTLDTRYDIVKPGVISFHPTRKSAGPWTVAQFGRNQMSGPVLRTSNVSAKTGKKKRAGKRFRRWNGQTAGKGTADDALKAIEPQVPKLVQKHITASIRKASLS